MSYDYILFDLDGTLTNPEEGITKAVSYALSHFGIDEPLDSLKRFIGPPLRVSFSEYYGFSKEDAETAVSKYREVYSIKGLYQNEVYDGIDTLLNTLKQNSKTLFVATSKPTIYAKKILKHFNLLDYFTFVGGCELDGTRDQKSEVIAYVIEQNNLTDLSKVIMIGDRKHDIIGAKENNLASIGVLYGFGDMDELKSANADFIAKDTAEIAGIILNANN